MTLVPTKALYAMFEQWQPLASTEDIYCDFVMSQSEEFFLNAPVPDGDCDLPRVVEMYGKVASKYPRWMPAYVGSIHRMDGRVAIELVKHVGIKIPARYVHSENLTILIMADMIDYSFGTVWTFAYAPFNDSVLDGTPLYTIPTSRGVSYIVSRIDCDGFAAYAATHGLDDPLVAHWLAYQMYNEHPDAAKLHLAMSRYFDNADNPRLICRKAKRERDVSLVSEDE